MPGSIRVMLLYFLVFAAAFVAAEALLARLELEEDSWVREELELALRG